MLFRNVFQKKRVYLDYAAATPMHPVVARVMRPFFSEVFANPSAIHKNGVLARRAIEEARLRLARVLKVRESGVVFTASGTESNNLALFGLVEAKRQSGLAYSDMEIVTTDIEHPSVANSINYLRGLGVVVKYVGVDAEGLVLMSELEELVGPKTVLVSVAYVNSEIGTIQDLNRITRFVKVFNQNNSTKVLVHTDAAQAPLWCDIDMAKLGVDVLTLDAGKCYGPKGVGVLAFRYGVEISPVLFGGSQEIGLRPGTENTPLVVGAVESIVRAVRLRKKNCERVTRLREQLITQLLDIDGVYLNGSIKSRVANNINISVPGIDTEFAVVSLDEAGVSVSTRSACAGADGAGSKVVRVVTGDEERAKSTLRITLGEETTVAELRRFLSVLRIHIDEQREFHHNLTRD